MGLQESQALSAQLSSYQNSQYEDDFEEDGSESSQSDDKTQPQFWKKDSDFYQLPENVRHAIEVGKQKAKHSEFYYKMKDLNSKVQVYKHLFNNRIPKYQRAYLDKITAMKQAQQEKARIEFQKEMDCIKEKEKQLKKRNTSIDIQL